MNDRKMTGVMEALILHCEVCEEWRELIIAGPGREGWPLDAAEAIADEFDKLHDICDEKRLLEIESRLE